ncbi:MAG: CPBP family intramembrane glutamic endopeptidase [bacterium]
MIHNKSWRESSYLALCEFAIVLLLFIADYYHLIPFSKTPFLLLLGWISLRMRRIGWKDVGMARPHNWNIALAAGILSGAGIELFELFVSQPLLIQLTGKPPDLSDFQPLAGNLKLLLLWLVLAWTLAACGEELVYRGYLMNRVAGLGNNTRNSWLVSLLLINTLFGFGHLYQGITGIIENIIDGSLLSLLYLACGRNLWVPIIAHGVTDTLDLLLIFLGKYPGM